MPKVAEAATLVFGNIIHVEESRNFESKEVDGLRLLIATATGEGFASVKLNVERSNELKPQIGHPVAWFVRYGASGGRERDAATYSAFVRPATKNDLDRLAGLIKQ